MTRGALALSVAVLTLVLASPASAATALVATVGPAFTISLTKGGKKVTSLPAGAYRITVRDRSGFHNFALTGPNGFRKATTVGFVGQRVWNVTLRRGAYRYVCTPHASIMRGTFRVT